MVDSPSDMPVRDSSPSLWVAALVFSLALHGVSIALLHDSRLATFTDDALSIPGSETNIIRVSVRDDPGEIDPDLFPELFPEAVRETPDEAIERLADANAALEDSVRAFTPGDASSLAWLPALPDALPAAAVDLESPELDPGFPEAAAPLDVAATPPKAAFEIALPAVDPEELLSRLDGAAPAPATVTAGTMSDVFKAALDAASGAGREAGAGGAIAAPAHSSAAMLDPFEISEKNLLSAAAAAKESAAAKASAAAQEAAAAAQSAGGGASTAAAQGVVVARTVEMPQVDEAFVAHERAAVEALKASQDGADLAPYVSLDFEVFADPAEPDAKYFRLKIAPRSKNLLPRPGKDLVILIDTSASIGTPRLAAASAAIAQILEEMQENDRFNLVAFADDWTYAFDAWQENTPENRRAANKWTASLRPKGYTDVFSTISSILTLPRDPARSLSALVITDGDATKGVYQTNEILSRFTRINGGLASIYFYGVKEDANAYLMDLLGMGNRGGWARHKLASAKSSDLEDKKRSAAELPAFARTFARPLISDFSVVFSRKSRAESYPRLVPNLYAGGAVEIYGRCPAGQEDVVFEMRGLNGGTVYDTFFQRRFAAAAKGDGEIKREWARRKIADLTLRYAAAPDPAVLEEMHRLAEAASIEIPYQKELEQ